MFFYTFMPKLFNMSLTASVAIVLVVLLRLLLKKAPKVISYALWGVVLFRLLCPVSIGSNFSVYNLFDAPAQESGTITSVIEYVPSNIVHTEYPSVALPVPGISDVINDALPQGQEQLVADPLEAPMSFATYAWMIGVLVMAIYSIVSYIRLRRKLSVVVPLRDNIFIADDIKSPFVVGLFRPKIYLPCNLGDKEQEYIILHEQHHIKRLDHVMKALAFLALCPTRSSKECGSTLSLAPPRSAPMYATSTDRRSPRRSLRFSERRPLTTAMWCIVWTSKLPRISFATHISPI